MPKLAEIRIERDKVPVNKATVIKQHGRQICIWSNNGDWHVFDHRCPHEGYPMSQGELSENCVLTCHWHNWKFDLRDGSNLDDLDRLKIYPWRWEADHLVIDVMGEDPEELRLELEDQLSKAFRDRDYTRIHRLVCRYQVSDLDGEDCLRFAIQWGYQRLQYGTTHAFAAAADWLTLCRQEDVPTRIAGLAEVLDHIAHDCLGHPVYPMAEGELKYDRRKFKQAIEEEDEEKAIMMARYCLANDARLELESVCRESVLEHYRDFGHSAIFLEKSIELSAMLGRHVEVPLFMAFVRGLCASTKEDLLPEFSRFQATVQSLSGITAGKRRPLMPCVGRPASGVMKWLIEHKEQGFLTLFEALVNAQATHMLSFDESWLRKTDIPISHNVGWLDFTHGLTFAEASWRMCQSNPDLWPQALCQLACFVGRTAAYVDKEALQQSAHAKAAAYTDYQSLVDHGIGLPIYACHRLKTYMAIRNLVPLLADDTGFHLWAAFAKYASSYYPHKQVMRTATQMFNLVNRDHG